MKKVTYILIVLFLISCTPESIGSLNSDTLIKKTFNKSEIKDLQKIIDFFNNEICNSNYENLNECYQNYCSKRKKQVELNVEFNTNINFEKQQKLYSKIQNNTFKEIWSFQKSLPIRERKDTLKYLSFNHNGKFVEFLKQYGNENKKIKNYYESFLMFRDISPSMFAGVLMEFEDYDIKDIRSKLIFAIHYLTLNDQNLREEKY